jgi:hypothetical protein
MKKILKIILGVIIFFTVPAIVLFGFIYFKYNEELPTGVQGEQADALARNMLDALNYEAYKETNYIEWTFKRRHHYKWNKGNETCEVYWKNNKVILDFKDASKNEVFIDDVKLVSSEASKYIKKATDYFNNDSFWVVAPYKVFDAGTERRIVALDNGNQALLITYTSGGSTPGDSYLWLLDKDNKPNAFKLWTSIIPIKGLEASWSDWTTTKNGTLLPTFHKLLVLGIEIENIKSE